MSRDHIGLRTASARAEHERVCGSLLPRDVDLAVGELLGDGVVRGMKRRGRAVQARPHGVHIFGSISP